MKACRIASFNQAVVCSFVPMLFLTFRRDFGLPLDQLAVLVTVNFMTQLAVDLLCARLLDKIGYRICIVIAHLFCAAGLISLPILPQVFPSAFGGLVAAVVLYAVGGGVIEVMITPIAEACPTQNKSASMSLVYSFYCWGSMAVILITTILFRLVGIENWGYISCLWAMVPLFNGILFLFVPIGRIVEEGRGMTLRELLREKTVWLLVLLMIFSGAAENSVSQWASAFAESALQVEKTVGDLAGPCLFAFLMGVGRIIYARLSTRIPLERYMAVSSIPCALSFLLMVLPQNPMINLLGCGLSGLAVAVTWPGTLSLAAARCPRGGTMLFALVALGGDIGCSLGPEVVGRVSGMFADDLRYGLGTAIIFPLLVIACVTLLKRQKPVK